MLGKLLKYELKNSFRFLIIFYALSLLFAVPARILGDSANSTFILVLSEIFKGATISMMCSTLINNSMRLWVMFKGNLYGDESYLTHTLPVEKSTLYIAKILNAVITLIVSVIVVIASLLILFYSDTTFEMFKTMLLPLSEVHGASLIAFIVLLAILIYVEFLSILQYGFSGIIIGHKFNTNKTLLSVIFGFVVYAVSQSAVIIPVLIIGIFNSDIMSIFTSNIAPSFEVLKTLLIICTVSYIAMFLIICFINTKLLKKGVNID